MPTLEIDVRPTGPFPQVLYECWCEQLADPRQGNALAGVIATWDNLTPDQQQFWRRVCFRILGRYMGVSTHRKVPRDPQKTAPRSITTLDIVPNNRQ
jgi:hypothetical protein